MARTFTLYLDGTEFEVKQQGRAILLNGKRFTPEITGDTVTIESAPHTVELSDNQAIFDGIAFNFETEGLEEKKTSLTDLSGGTTDSDGAVTAIMPGLIISVAVAEGDTVSSGDVLVVLEAMKMESEICSPVDGVVKEVKVKAGDNVSQSQLLVLIESESDDDVE